MNWTEIYNAVCYRVWGASTPPEGAATNLQGQFGIIATIHRNIQKDRNYWFMEATTTISVVAGTSAYALPSGFKGLVKDGLRFLIGTTQYSQPLEVVMPGEYSSFNDTAETDDYPQFYEIFADQLVLNYLPKSNQTLNMRYYKYLDRPPAVFGTTSDAFTLAAPDVIYNFAAAEMLAAEESLQKAQIYEAKGKQSLDLLIEEDAKRRRSDVKIRYEDV